jgi:nitrite reductase (NADH) small subunit
MEMLAPSEFRSSKGEDGHMNWISIGTLSDIPRRGARCVATPQGKIAVFRTADDQVFAIEDHCPHKGGPLSQGIVHGAAVTCPLHNWVISLETGKALGADEGAVRTMPVKIDGERLFLALEALASRAA